MEQVLDTYQRPVDPNRPVVCVDEISKTLHQQVREPLPPCAGQGAREDYEYRRNGTRNLFMITAPFVGWRTVQVTARRTRVDFALVLKDLVDKHFPTARQITVVCDNLNTHKLGVLYDVFNPATAHRLRQKLTFVYTPKHASWLNIAEIENSVLQRQCLQRRIPDEETLVAETKAWYTERNTHGAPVDWRFTTDQARIKLRKLYPSI